MLYWFWPLRILIGMFCFNSVFTLFFYFIIKFLFECLAVHKHAVLKCSQFATTFFESIGSILIVFFSILNTFDTLLLARSSLQMICLFCNLCFSYYNVYVSFLVLFLVPFLISCLRVLVCSIFYFPFSSFIIIGRFVWFFLILFFLTFICRRRHLLAFLYS